MKKFLLGCFVFLISFNLFSKILFNPQTIYIGQEVTFSIDNSRKCSSCSWDFGDNTAKVQGIADYKSVKHTYKKAGNYLITFTFGGCQGGDTTPSPMMLQITVLDNRTITVTPKNPFVYEEVTFSLNNSITSLVKWDFGDNSAKPMGGKTIKHTYFSAGTYTIKAVEKGYLNAPITTTITVGPDPRKVTYLPTNPRVGETINFAAKNFKSTSLKWDFGDGTTKSGTNSITHVYGKEGTYNIKVFDKNGNDEFPITFNLLIQKDMRTVSWTPKDPKRGDSIVFTAKNFKSTSLKWDFGDNTVVNGSKSASHSYKVAGTYTLKVYDSKGQDKFPLIYNLKVREDLRNLMWSPNSPAEGENIVFIAKNFDSSNLLWDFGDGIKERGSSKTIHSYRKVGIYEIKVYENNGKDQNPFKTKIQINRDIRKISWTPQNPLEMEEVNFKLSNFYTGDYLWRFGDRVEVNTKKPSVSHTFRKSGEYTVRVYDNKGKFSTPIVAKIKVLPDLRKVELRKKRVHVGESLTIKTINFKSNSLLWNFGDGTKKIGKQAENHIYKKVGTYTISVKDKGGKDLKTFKTQVQVLPDQRKIELSSNKVGIGEKLTLKALNFYSTNIFWDFGDGIKKIGKTYESHFYRKKGKYIIKATDYAGKDDKTFTKSVEVIVKKSHASSLEISKAELFFLKTMKNYAVVSKEEKMLGAKVKIKFEGTGILTAYWKIDDKSFKLINTPLSFGQYKVFTLKNIPVHGFGLHKLSFTIKSPSTKVNLFGYYFVSPSKKKIQIIIPEDNSIVKKRDVSLKWEKVKKASYYRITIAQTILSLFKKPEKKSLEKKNSYIANLKKSKESEQRYFWFVEALDKDKNIIACSDINSFLLK